MTIFQHNIVAAIVSIGVENNRFPNQSYSIYYKFIVLPLTLIYSTLLVTEVFSDIWKVARVTPIFNSGARGDMSNYRPISVLSLFARMLEKIVHYHLIDYFKEKQMLKKHQHTFRKINSTVISLVKSTDEWLEYIHSQKVNMTMLLDPRKIFDTVDHKILLENFLGMVCGVN